MEQKEKKYLEDFRLVFDFELVRKIQELHQFSEHTTKMFIWDFIESEFKVLEAVRKQNEKEIAHFSMRTVLYNVYNKGNHTHDSSCENQANCNCPIEERRAIHLKEFHFSDYNSPSNFLIDESIQSWLKEKEGNYKTLLIIETDKLKLKGSNQ